MRTKKSEELVRTKEVSGTVFHGRHRNSRGRDIISKDGAEILENVHHVLEMALLVLRGAVGTTCIQRTGQRG